MVCVRDCEDVGLLVDGCACVLVFSRALQIRREVQIKLRPLTPPPWYGEHRSPIRNT